jgi:hypothetical protein
VEPPRSVALVPLLPPTFKTVEPPRSEALLPPMPTPPVVPTSDVPPLTLLVVVAPPLTEEVVLVAPPLPPDGRIALAPPLVLAVVLVPPFDPLPEFSVPRSLALSAQAEIAPIPTKIGKRYEPFSLCMGTPDVMRLLPLFLERRNRTSSF